ncbi:MULTISPECIES: L-threonylcarbamoyladenylate synthase [unclassified Vibrio]|uniref:Threonylcarbamoyl-AMP synthase n=1 Tax=Vibrio sp. HB236076 TaxID=3232307 RepID=A0AB39HJF1_9VIBR|nr:L-threonylcarbamoyladenylate synthase [Vibrio sp. HB161653]MDP5254250.1 L-threonylcarbamoyladenylate synthase [Vibrio sp. HB161653]
MNTLKLAATSRQDLQTAAQLLQQGKRVALPTETVYGLAADATQPDAVKGIFAAKGRPANHPLIVHIGDIAQLSEWVESVSEDALTLAKTFWPGPLTLLLKKSTSCNSVVTGGLETVAVRIPSHPVMLSLLQKHRLAVAAPSANLYKQLSPTNADQVLDGLDGRIEAVVDGGDCLFGLESTIVDLTSEAIQVLRAGPITAHQLSECLGKPVTYPESHNVAVPGNVGSHYQPQTLLRLVGSLSQSLEQRDRSLTYAVLHTTAFAEEANVHSLAMPLDAQEYGNKLYRYLAKADKLKVDEIWLEQPPTGEEWNAIHDRLSRAALPL